jgi:alpha-N-acetylglucosaminidase
MYNVLPGFSGHIPHGLLWIYPNASVVRSADWNNFGDVYSEDYLLEPTDPLFKKIGEQYYKILIDEFGTDHFFNADTYNEMDPSSKDHHFLAETNKAIYEAMANVDKEAVFVMQGWLFHSSTRA